MFSSFQADSLTPRDAVVQNRMLLATAALVLAGPPVAVLAQWCQDHVLPESGVGTLLAMILAVGLLVGHCLVLARISTRQK